jgi:hypothetical protein
VHVRVETDRALYFTLEREKIDKNVARWKGYASHVEFRNKVAQGWQKVPRSKVEEVCDVEDAVRG